MHPIGYSGASSPNGMTESTIPRMSDRGKSTGFAKCNAPSPSASAPPAGGKGGAAAPPNVPDGL